MAATTYETLLTPATCVASDDEVCKSQGDARQSSRRWKGGLGKRSSQTKKLDLTTRTAPTLRKGGSNKDGGGPAEVTDKKKAKSSNVVKRAIHKMKKKSNMRSSSSSSKVAASSHGGEIDPAAAPKV